ncbi:MAG TPA: hypothetical protein VMU78_06450 [Methylocella sp.]|nr:hypothetical protein [Methylocella sp.]
MFAQFSGGFRQFGDLENLATKAALAARFSGDCKHEFLVMTIRFGELNSVIAKALAQEGSSRRIPMGYVFPARPDLEDGSYLTPTPAMRLTAALN